jgi:rhodanese-related sulfurtransferase
LIGAALLVFLVKKWWQRNRFLKTLRMARISVDELYQLLQQGQAPTIVDVRSALSKGEGRIPGAVTMSIDDTLLPALDILHDSEVIVYCACPNEASAARLAKRLMQRGYSRVRPLTGGIDAWVAAGYPIEP